MRQVLQHLDDGRTTMVDAPAPGSHPDSLLIRTSCSLISAGTERMLVDFGRAGWIGKARQQPEKVRAILNKVRAEGLLPTVRALRAKLGQPIPLGYCQVGTVVDAGGQEESAGQAFNRGDRVVSNGPHAEVVSVNRNLCARIPDGISDEAATFAPLAAIALQGVNLLSPAPGEKILVIGLGLIGQLSVRILRAIGCEVLGIDPSGGRRMLAEAAGAAVPSPEVDPVAAAMAWTAGKGLSGVLVTASSPSNEIINQAARSCRHRGKVVLVGVVGLLLNRADFYRNEVSFQVSCSYGRRDHTGGGSAQANFRQVLAWMSERRLAVEDLITHRFEFERAPAAYEALSDRKALGILLEYRAEPSEGLLARTMKLRDGKREAARPGVALVGAGNFAMRTLLPALAGLEAPPELRAVVSRQGLPAYLAARKFDAAMASTDDTAALADELVQAVFVATRHDDHAHRAIAALKAGKHVWVEKPLALTLEDLAGVQEVMSGLRSSLRRPPILFVGFNRRFSPFSVALRRALAGSTAPVRFDMTINAGRLDPEHWTMNPRTGGGRIVGEGCHFVDLLRFLGGSAITAVRCTRRDADGQDGGRFELAMGDRRLGVIDYRTDLPAHIPKERVEVAGDGFRATILNWAKLRSRGLHGPFPGPFWGGLPRKGHREALRSFLAAVDGGPPPIAFDEIAEVSRWSIRMQGMSAGQELSV